MDLCFSELESDSHSVGLIEKKIPKEGWGNRKKYPWAESRICVFKSLCVRVRVCERENNSFGITAIIFKASNPLFKKDFKSAELLTKTSFFLCFRDRPKTTKEEKERRKFKRKTN